MKSILTLTMNPAIDVSSSAPNVFPEHKLRCGPVHHEPDGGGINVSRAIRNPGDEAVVVSLGAPGVLFASSAGCERMRSPTVPVRSKVGAGDSMVAGIALALTREQPLRDAVRFGVAAGAAVVMTAGTKLCRREDAERLFEQMR